MTTDSDPASDSNSDSNSLASRLRREVDELKLQLHLGSAEAADFIEEKKEHLGGIVDETKALLESGVDIAEEKALPARQKLDELRVQLALGRMESREAYEEQKEQIHAALDAAREGLDDLGDSAGDQFAETRGHFDHGVESFKTQLDALALNLGLGAVATSDALRLKREQLGNELEDWSHKLHDVAELAEDEARSAYASVRETIAHLLR